MSLNSPRLRHEENGSEEKELLYVPLPLPLGEVDERSEDGEDPLSQPHGEESKFSIWILQSASRPKIPRDFRLADSSPKGRAKMGNAFLYQPGLQPSFP